MREKSDPEIRIQNGKEPSRMAMNVNVKKLSPEARLPQYGTEFSAGADLYALCPEPVTVAPGETVLIHTGLSLEIPQGYGGFLYARSGLATKRGLAPANKVGVIDADYRGEVMVALYNQSSQMQTVENGERIAQLVIAPFLKAEFTEAEHLEETLRGTGGFGSTGK